MPPVYGGAGAQAFLLGRALSKMGWEVTAITLDQDGVGSGLEEGVRFQRLLRGKAPASKWSRALTTLALGVGASLHILSRRPSIVHIHGAFWWSIPPAIAGRLTRAKVVVKLTRDGDDDPRTVFAKKLGPLHVGRFHGLSLSLAHAVIALNEDVRANAASVGLGDRTHLIPNGVDVETLTRSDDLRQRARASMTLTEEDRVVMFVGYLVRHKGVRDLLDAWRAIQNRDVHLWLVGPFEGFHRELEDDIPILVNKMIAEGYRVKAFGQVPVKRLPELYWAADVFVLPSYAEGMPNSLAEALVAGCHVVATRIPGITELMGVDSVDLVTPGDVEQLTKRLAAAIENPRPAPRGLTERLGISHIAAVYESLYSDLLVVRRP